jgi:hypothetical protein
LAPDFARTVDIHRKPGYDPVELFIDPELQFAELQIAWKLLKKKLGFRQLLDVTSLNANLVKGSHGRPPDRGEEGPVLLGTRTDLLGSCKTVEPTSIKQLILDHF